MSVTCTLLANCKIVLFEKSSNMTSIFFQKNANLVLSIDDRDFKNVIKTGTTSFAFHTLHEKAHKMKHICLFFLHNGSFHSRCRILLEKDDFKSSSFGLQIIHEIDVISENIEKMTLLFSMQQTLFENERGCVIFLFQTFQSSLYFDATIK